MTSDLLAWLRQRPPTGNAAWGEPFPASRVLAPDWPRAAEVVDIVRRHPPSPEPSEDGARLDAAWEACAAAGLIPARWVDDGERRFVFAGADGMEEGPRPPGRRAVVAFAGAAAGVAAAERLLLDHREAMQSYAAGQRVAGAPPARWYCWVDQAVMPWEHHLWDGGPQVPDLVALGALARAKAHLPRATEEGIDAFARRVSARGAWLKVPAEESLRRLLLRAARQGEAAARGLEAPGHAPGLAGRTFASLADPYAPLVGVWALGFAAPLATRADLVMPAWGAPAWGPPAP